MTKTRPFIRLRGRSIMALVLSPEPPLRDWLATKEAVEIYSRGDDAATLRTDVDESFLDPAAVPRPGVVYPDDTDPTWRSTEKLEIGGKIRALLKKP